MKTRTKFKEFTPENHMWYTNGCVFLDHWFTPDKVYKPTMKVVHLASGIFDIVQI